MQGRPGRHTDCGLLVTFPLRHPAPVLSLLSHVISTGSRLTSRSGHSRGDQQADIVKLEILLLRTRLVGRRTTSSPLVARAPIGIVIQTLVFVTVAFRTTRRP